MSLSNSCNGMTESNAAKAGGLSNENYRQHVGTDHRRSRGENPDPRGGGPVEHRPPLLARGEQDMPDPLKHRSRATPQLGRGKLPAQRRRASRAGTAPVRAGRTLRELGLYALQGWFSFTFEGALSVEGRRCRFWRQLGHSHRHHDSDCEDELLI
jgi:hypothetical protein